MLRRLENLSGEDRLGELGPQGEKRRLQGTLEQLNCNLKEFQESWRDTFNKGLE